jgi:hypothetical protein
VKHLSNRFEMLGKSVKCLSNYFDTGSRNTRRFMLGFRFTGSQESYATITVRRRCVQRGSSCSNVQEVVFAAGESPNCVCSHSHLKWGGGAGGLAPDEWGPISCRRRPWNLSTQTVLRDGSLVKVWLRREIAGAT